MTDFSVTVNRWVGEGYEKPWISCCICHKAASVIDLNGDRVCAACLNKALKVIDQEVRRAGCAKRD